MAQIQGLINIYNNQTGDATKVNTNFDNIKTVYNTHDSDTDNVHQIPNGEVIASDVSLQTLIDKLFPIGEIIDIWRPSDIAGFVEIDSDIYTMVQGQEIDDEDSLFNEITLPDLSGRYLIGAGELSSGDIGTVEVNTTPVGNENHAVDLEHSHDGSASHTHGSTHNHSVTAHSHNITGGQGYLAIREDYIYYGGTNFRYGYFYIHSEGWVSYETVGNVCNKRITASTSYPPGESLYSSSDDRTEDMPKPSGTISTLDNVLINPSSPTLTSETVDTSTDMSSTFNIQPKSLPVKRYIRYK